MEEGLNVSSKIINDNVAVSCNIGTVKKSTQPQLMATMFVIKGINDVIRNVTIATMVGVVPIFKLANSKSLATHDIVGQYSFRGFLPL